MDYLAKMAGQGMLARFCGAVYYDWCCEVDVVQQTNTTNTIQPKRVNVTRFATKANQTQCK